MARHMRQRERERPPSSPEAEAARAAAASLSARAPSRASSGPTPTNERPWHPCRRARAFWSRERGRVAQGDRRPPRASRRGRKGRCACSPAARLNRCRTRPGVCSSAANAAAQTGAVSRVSRANASRAVSSSARRSSPDDVGTLSKAAQQYRRTARHQSRQQQRACSFSAASHLNWRVRPRWPLIMQGKPRWARSYHKQRRASTPA